MYILGKQVVMTCKSWHSFSVYVLLQGILQDHTQLINYTAVSSKYYGYVSPSMP